MDKSGIMHLLSALQTKRITTLGAWNFNRWNWVNSTCPLASVSHEKGTDKRPSFGILINEKGESLYQCFTCTDPAPLSGLIHNLWMLDISGWPEAMEIYGKHEIFSNTDKVFAFLPQWENREEKTVQKTEVPEIILDKFPLLQMYSGYEAKRCKEFLSESRGIDTHTQNHFRLRFSENDRLIIFPRIDKEERIWWLRARSRLSKVFFSISHTYASNKWGDEAVRHPNASRDFWGDSSHFFGEQFLTKEPVIIVESETDVLRLHTLGIYNVIASGGGIQKAQLDRLYHNVVILGFDADIPGLKNRIKAEKYFKGYSTLFALDWKIAGIKDAGELGSRADFDKVYNKKILL